MLAIHAPVPIIVIARIFTGVHYELRTLPFFLLCYGLGQYAGGKIGDFIRKRRSLIKNS